MSDLATEWLARYSGEKAVQLTNPDVPNATTVDTTRLDKAVRDVKSDFNIYANTLFDENLEDHINAGCEGVTLKLQMRQLNVDPSDLRKQWTDILEALGQSVGGRTKTQPVSNAVSTPSVEESGSKPLFDESRFKPGYAPQPPGSSSTSGFPTDRE